MNKQKLCAFALVCMLLACTVFAAACNQTTTTGKKVYNVTYQLNYDGADSRVYPVQAGTTAPDWQPVREGYRLDYWATDKDGAEKYNLSAKVYDDITLYAVWKQKPGIATVTFNFGYAGAADKVVEVEKQCLVSERYKPTQERFGMELVGWYKDEALTEEWNFDSDIVTDNTVLHAKYRYTINIPRNADGSIKYENTKVYVWNAIDYIVQPEIMDKLIADFNKQYEGKIVVEQGTALENQADVFLRIQQTPEQMTNYSTYYPVADIFSFAGLDFSNDDFYQGAINECKNKGVVLQTPIAAFAPYFVYNKTLMQKYNGDNPLPTNYSELSALLQKAADGESANTKFKSIVTLGNWMYQEAPSYTAFAQNDIDYYSYTGGTYFNNWQAGDNMSKAVRAMQNTYDLFGVNGLNKGEMLATGTSLSKLTTQVSSGNALLGMLSWYGQEEKIANNSDLGVLPMAGLFTDETGEASGRTPVHGWGIGFYKYATNVLADSLKVCAAAEFTKYVMDHAYEFAAGGFAPLCKTAIENEAYVNSESKAVQLVHMACAPENFYTLPGFANLKTVVNKTAAQGVIVPYLRDANATRDMIEAKTRELYAQVAGLVG